MSKTPEEYDNSTREVLLSKLEILHKNRTSFDYFVKKPEVKEFSEITEDSPSIFYVPESEQVIGSFKIAGPAAYMLTNIDRAAKGVVAPSAGNHAQGVALVASELGIPATIFMPESAPLVKQQAVFNLGAKIKLVSGGIGNAEKAAAEFALENKQTVIPPYDDPAIIAGNAMLYEHVPKNTDYIFTPVGGGGLAAGLAFANSLNPNGSKIIGVRPPSQETFDTFRFKPKGDTRTIADGAAVSSIGKLPLEIFQETKTQVRRVSEELIYEAMALQYELTKEEYGTENGVMPEGAGALAFAGVLSSLYSSDELLNKNVAIIASGKNIDEMTKNHVLRSARALQNGLYSQSRREFII